MRQVLFNTPLVVTRKHEYSQIKVDGVVMSSFLIIIRFLLT